MNRKSERIAINLINDNDKVSDSHESIEIDPESASEDRTNDVEHTEQKNECTKHDNIHRPRCQFKR